MDGICWGKNSENRGKRVKTGGTLPGKGGPWSLCLGVAAQAEWRGD